MIKGRYFYLAFADFGVVIDFLFVVDGLVDEVMFDELEVRQDLSNLLSHWVPRKKKKAIYEL